MINFKKKTLEMFELEKRLLFDASLPAIAGQVLWLDADDTSTVLDAEGDNAASGAAFSGSVQTWQDKSGSGFHVTAGAAGERPTYNATGLNSNGTIVFDGIDDKLTRLTSSAITGDDITVFIVFNKTNAVNNRDALFELTNGSSSRNALFVGNISGTISFFNNSFFNFSGAQTAGTYYLSSSIYDNTSINLFNNGAAAGAFTGVAARTLTNLIYIGDDSTGGDNLQGNIAELIIYDRDLTGDERHDVENYLAAKWNLSITNATPTVSTNTGATLNEGATTTITSAMLSAVDTDNTDTLLRYTLTDAVDQGTLFRDTDGDNVIDTGETLTLSSIFTQSDINSGLIKYRHNGSETTTDSFAFTVTDQVATTSSATFNLTITPVNDAPVIDGWTQISFEDFQSGATGWANNTTTTDAGAFLTRYLGPFSNDSGVQSNSKTYTLSGNQSYTVMQFDFYRLDTWDTEAFRVFINDTQVFNQTFTTGMATIADGSSGIVSWTVTERNTIAQNLGNSSSNDQIFRFEMTVQNAAASTIKIGFGSTTNQATNDEAWGIDNVRIFEAASGGTPGAFAVAENTANTSVVGRITASDAESNTISYSITGGTGSSAFAINSTTGVITVANSALLNFESVTSYTLTVRATDNGSPAAFDEETITINILDIPENTAPTINPAGPFNLAENSANGTVVGTVTGSDPDGNTITWSITGGNTGNAFAINASTGAITVATSSVLNFESLTSFTLQVRATDNGPGAFTANRNITINLTNVNEAPTFDAVSAILQANPNIQYNATTGNFYRFISTTANYATATSNANATLLNGIGGYISTVTSAAENTFIRSLAGTSQIWLGGSDSVAEGVWRWANGGTESGAQFWQGAGSGAGGTAQNGLYTNWNGTAEPNNSGVAPGEDFMVMLNTGFWNDITGTSNNPYVIEWNGSNLLAAVSSLQNGPYTVAENSPNTTSVGFLEAFDIDASSTLTFTITGGTGNTIFNVNGSTGEITVANSSALDFETIPSYTLNVRVQDAGGLFDTRTVTINLTNVNETPTNVSLSATAINENSALGTVIGALSSIDVDDADTFSYSIQADPDSKFVIVGNELRVNGDLNHEAVGSHSITIRTTDFGGLFFDRVFTININDINEAPTLAAVGPFAFDENISSGTSIVTMAGADVDTGQTLSYSMQSGNTGSMFAIDAATGEITFAASPDFETLNTYSLVIRVADNGTGSLFAERTVVININDINEAPTLAAVGPFAFDENISSGTSVVTMAGADVDAGQTLTYSIQSGNTGSMFAIDTATGEITFAASPDFETLNTYSLVIRVADNGTGSLFAERTVVININDINETPSDIFLSANTVVENSNNGTVIGFLTTTDPETFQTHTYSLVNETSGRFIISGNQLLVNGPIDYELSQTIDITIRTDDNNGATFDKIFTLSILDINENSLVFIPPNTDTQFNKFNGGNIEDDVRKILELNTGNYIQSVLTGIDKSIMQSFYGDSLTQIIRENLTLSMQLFSFNLINDFIVLQDSQIEQPENFSQVLIPQEPARYTNIREALAALDAFHQEKAIGAQQVDNIDNKIAYNQFEDVLRYQEKRQQQLREALQ